MIESSSNGWVDYLSPAKLNLFLHITGRRPNGYHDLQSVFQLLDYGDTIRFKKRDDSTVALHCDHPALNSPDNLILKAAKQLQVLFPNKVLGADIALKKVLPLGGGVGGGSSNAATTLIALNTLWQLSLNQQTLLDIAVKLGADVPFFVKGHTAWVEGIGELITPIERNTKWYFVMRPDCHVSTMEIFQHPSLTRNSKALTIRAFLDNEDNKVALTNVCQTIACNLHPQISEALNWLNQFGQARMTGTGACIFLEFDKQEEISKIIAQMSSSTDYFVAKGINKMPWSD
ncbi:MAG: 4-(cytidine 5'-diphospho)-2-C-methyl-D-erythritol kinase [Pseudomonadota bacterium]